MNIFEAIIIVLRLWSILTVVVLFIYMIYAINVKNEQVGTFGLLSLIIIPLIYPFIKNEKCKRKIIVLGLFIFSIIIFILTMKNIVNNN